VDQAKSASRRGQRLKHIQQVMEFFTDNLQLFGDVALHTVMTVNSQPVRPPSRIADRAELHRQAVHLAQHLPPILAVFIDRCPWAVAVLVIGHPHAFALDKSNDVKGLAFALQPFHQVPLPRRHSPGDPHAVVGQIVDKIDFRLDLLERAVRAVRDAQDHRLLAKRIIENQILAAQGLRIRHQRSLGGAVQGSGRA
jgi:hypothetical protein